MGKTPVELARSISGRGNAEGVVFEEVIVVVVVDLPGKENKWLAPVCPEDVEGEFVPSPTLDMAEFSGIMNGETGDGFKRPWGVPGLENDRSIIGLLFPKVSAPFFRR
jgi:hypothetical protein